jgi:hypothetical protein
MKLVVIESPYAGDVERNLRYLRAAMADCLRRGESPYASHGLLTQPGVLRDDVPDERARGIRAGFAWGEKADIVAVYEDLGVSSGMLAGIERAEKRGTPVERRRVPGWGADSEERLHAALLDEADRLTELEVKMIDRVKCVGPTIDDDIRFLRDSFEASLNESLVDAARRVAREFTHGRDLIPLDRVPVIGAAMLVRNSGHNVAEACDILRSGLTCLRLRSASLDDNDDFRKSRDLAVAAQERARIIVWLHTRRGPLMDTSTLDAIIARLERGDR